MVRLLMASGHYLKLLIRAVLWRSLENNFTHYGDVIMGPMASQITSLTIVYSTFYSGADQKKTSKLRVTGLCVGNSPGTQMASNAENVSIWWGHHAPVPKLLFCMMSWKMILTKWLPHFPGANELSSPQNEHLYSTLWSYTWGIFCKVGWIIRSYSNGIYALWWGVMNVVIGWNFQDACILTDFILPMLGALF